jgi:hypothetical protein
LSETRVARFFIGTTYQNGKNISNYQNILDGYELNLPDGRKIDQLSIRYTNIPISLQFPSKFTQNGIYGLKINHLATLSKTRTNSAN